MRMEANAIKALLIFTACVLASLYCIVAFCATNEMKLAGQLYKYHSTLWLHQGVKESKTKPLLKPKPQYAHHDTLEQRRSQISPFHNLSKCQVIIPSHDNTLRLYQPKSQFVQ
mmetsp:Transcript_6320/g.15725  ORF Transcript_6320/g.15725 Transcript_6320/m.15725 type:complete len:113 (+) Transcript_6320:73-411(+)